MPLPLDPWNDATNAGERSGVFYGRIDANAQHVVLQKGTGKAPFNPNVHSHDDRRTELFISLNPLDEMNLTKAIERNVIAESREWSGIVWASLRTLGLTNARELHGKYAKCELVKTGRTWQKNGETVEGTTFKFLALYKSREECAAAFRADRGGSQPAADEDVPFDTAPAPANNHERETALKFLEPIVKASNGDRNVLSITIAGMPLLAKFFTVDSPEVQALMKVAA
jgi:hypothetical protein